MQQVSGSVKEREKERYLAYRIRVLPEQLENAYRKAEALQREAKRMGLNHIIREIKP